MAAPIGNTCPDINRLQKSIRSLQSDLKYVPEEGDDIIDFFKQISSELDSIHGSLEDLRNDNDTLRTYGRQMEEEAEFIQVQYNELEEKYNELLENN